VTTTALGAVRADRKQPQRTNDRDPGPRLQVANRIDSPVRSSGSVGRTERRASDRRPREESNVEVHWKSPERGNPPEEVWRRSKKGSLDDIRNASRPFVMTIVWLSRSPRWKRKSTRKRPDSKVDDLIQTSQFIGNCRAASTAASARNIALKFPPTHTGASGLRPGMQIPLADSFVATGPNSATHQLGLGKGFFYI
jgi:hypothetical protein